MQLRGVRGTKMRLGWLVLLTVLGVQQANAMGSHPLVVQGGVLTVDGMTARTGVELRIENLRYLYVALPGEGTAVVAERPFAGAHEQKGAFHGRSLTVEAGGRHVQMTASNRMRGTRSAYVRFDRGLGPAKGLPMMSYGDAAMVPAVWPEGTAELHDSWRRVRAQGRRSARSAKLCRPSRHGHEVCATVREVMYHPSR